MTDEFVTALSTHDETSVTVRDRSLTTEVMGEMDFGGAVYLLLAGEPPTEAESRVVNAMLSSLMVHGFTPHSLAARLTLLSEPASTQGAIASGLLGVGSRFAGAMEGCARDLQSVAGADDTDESIRELVTGYRERGEAFSGIGHAHFDPVDPRAERLFELADEDGITGDHVEILREVQSRFEEEVGRDLPINVTGAIAAVTSDMGLPPEAGRGIAIVSRAAGLTAEVIEERQSPIARDVWEYVSDHRTYGGDE